MMTEYDVIYKCRRCGFEFERKAYGEKNIFFPQEQESHMCPLTHELERQVMGVGDVIGWTKRD